MYTTIYTNTQPIESNPFDLNRAQNLGHFIHLKFVLILNIREGAKN